MKKEEFITKYGQEAWERNLENVRRWSKEHKRKKSDYTEEEWSKKLASGRKWKAEHKHQHLSGVKKWQTENQDKVKIYKKTWKKNHPMETRAQNLCAAYKSADISEGRGDCALTKTWIMEHIFASRCIYCGDSDWTHLGADRIDNSKPHTPDNCVCACGICNIERNDRYTVEEFIEYRKKNPRTLLPKLL